MKCIHGVFFNQFTREYIHSSVRVALWIQTGRITFIITTTGFACYSLQRFYRLLSDLFILRNCIHCRVQTRPMTNLSFIDA